MALKTFSHLLKLNHRPTEYEIICSDLLYYTKNGFEVKTPIGDWYEKYQKNALISCHDWEKFKDPRETTYSKYTFLQKQKEFFVEGIFKYIHEKNYDAALDPDWLQTLDVIFTPLRYLFHGMQMVISYIGQMAPSGRIVITSMLQAADEMRRVQHVAYRMRQIQLCHTSFGLQSKDYWQQHPAWQPTRKTIEHLLVSYDWSEAFIALNLVVKPLMDNLLIHQFGELAKKRGDFLLNELLHSLEEDCQWQLQWSEALLKVMLQEPGNREKISRVIDKWHSATLEALQPLCNLINGDDKILLETLQQDYAEFLHKHLTWSVSNACHN